MDIKEIVKQLKGKTAAAKILGVSRQTIHNWLSGKVQINDLRRQDIERRLAQLPMPLQLPRPKLPKTQCACCAETAPAAPH